MRTPVLIFSVALLVRLLGLGVYGVDRSGDAAEYERLASNLLRGHGYSLSAGAPFEPTTQREPLYPVFLAAVYRMAGPAPVAVVVVQCLLGSLTCVLVWAIARHLYEDHWVARVAGLANAGYLPIAIFNLRLLSETTATFLMALIAYQLVRIVGRHDGWIRYTVLGIATGLLILNKLIFQLLPIVIVAVLLLAVRGRPRLAKTLWGLLLTAALVAPWVVYNKSVHGSYAFGNSVRMAANLYVRVANDGMKGPLDMRTEFYLRLRDLERQGVETRALNASYVRQALQIIRAHPVRYLAGTLLEIKDLWRFGLDAREIDVTGPIAVHGLKGILHRSVKTVFQVVHLGVLCTGLLGFMRQINWRSGVLMALILYSTAILALLSCALPRHNVPVLPFMLIFSSSWLVRVAGRAAPSLAR